MKHTLGFIGVGIMGCPMAIHLAEAGCKVLVYENNKKAPVVAEHGAIPASLKQMAEACDIIFLIVSNGQVVQEILFGKDEKPGMLPDLRPGTLICDMTSISAAQARSFHQKLSEAGIHYVDAPVSGGDTGAINATLAFMAGGSQADYETLVPYFEIMGRTHTLVGEAGAGSIAKLANQIIVAGNLAAMAEAFAFSAKADVDPAKVFEAIRAGFAQSTVMDVRMPHVLEGDFTPGGTLITHRKDLNNILETGKAVGASLPLSEEIYRMMSHLIDEGMGNQDHSGLIHYYEEKNGVKVSRR